MFVASIVLDLVVANGHHPFKSPMRGHRCLTGHRCAAASAAPLVTESNMSGRIDGMVYYENVNLYSD